MNLCSINVIIGTILKRKFSRNGVNRFLCSNSENKHSTQCEFGPKYVPHEIEHCPLRDHFFKPPLTSTNKFTLILPPPNVTGSLHLGHALTATIQDVLVKWHRMRGTETVWVPGMDHAGIATQVIVEKKLWTEKKLTRHDVGRDKFIDEIWTWKHEKSATIKQQLLNLGLSLDWNKETFTMDPRQSDAVIEAFVRLFESGLVYESDALVNWSCVLRSAISDIEVDHLEITGPTRIDIPGYEKPVEFGVLTKFAYKLDDPGGQSEIVVCTTRPETILGDVAVAVHPNDDRYKAFVGKQVWHPFRREFIPIISDDFVDPSFGTGAVKITPAHDPTDFEVSKRHGLPVLPVIREDGTVRTEWKEANGMARFDVRTRILEELRATGVYRGRQDHPMKVPICNRSRDVVEFLVKRQWFIRCKEMARRASDDARDGRLNIHPEQFRKTWFDWLENIRDWCVSRQLWWGHKIPIYHCKHGNSAEVYKTAARDINEARVRALEHFGTAEDLVIKQEDDVLDTWFSSALLPFSNFGWPGQTDQLNSNYPLSVMETGHDILFFWVARMVMLGTQLTGRLPFDKVILHGVICDGGGKKMSKSHGNVISPEDVISGRTLQELAECSKKGLQAGLLSRTEFEKAVKSQRSMFPDGIPQCGVDALRLTLCSGNIKSHYIKFDVLECNSNKLFGNKLWQATKFTLKWCEIVAGQQKIDAKPPTDFSGIDKWMLSRLSHAVEVINGSLETADLHVAVAALKTCLYYEFCDVYLEATKRGLGSTESNIASAHCWVLVRVLDVGLRCLSPFMPYICQHLHEQLTIRSPFETEITYYPKQLHFRDEHIENEVEIILAAVIRIRRLKNIFNVTGKPPVILVTNNDAFKTYKSVIEDLSRCGEILIRTNGTDLTGEEYISDTITGRAAIHLGMPKNWKKSPNYDCEKLDKKRAKLVGDLEKMNRLISADGYKVKVLAPAHELNLRKIANIQENISRIDLVQKFAKTV